MNKFKESSQYLFFFRQYITLLIISAIVGLAAAFWFNSQKPTVYVVERLFQYEYSIENASAVEKIVDQSVTVLRSAQLKELLGVSQSTNVIYKPGPFAINIQTKSENDQIAINNLEKLSNYLKNTYNAQEVGLAVFYKENSHPERTLLIGGFAGMFIGMLLMLIISYFKHY